MFDLGLAHHCAEGPPWVHGEVVRSAAASRAGSLPPCTDRMRRRVENFLSLRRQVFCDPYCDPQDDLGLDGVIFFELSY